MDFKKFWKESFAGFVLKRILLAITIFVALAWITLLIVDQYTRHGEFEVGEDENGEADVAASRVQEVRPTDAGAAVAHHHDHLENRPGELDPGRIGDAPAVQAVEGAGDEVLI